MLANNCIHIALYGYVTLHISYTILYYCKRFPGELKLQSR